VDVKWQLCAGSSFSPGTEAALLERRRSSVSSNIYCNHGPYGLGFKAPISVPGLHSLQIYKYIATLQRIYCICAAEQQ
jgi:hypothetical protein